MDKTVLRLVTTGSVDDGKSTLIGRLLYETNCVPEDQYEAIKKYSEKRGKEDVDLSFLLDGLESEREQGITIDVAYRYFETDKRKFIVADSPGHEQYTRNMVTGASNADAAMILIDARNGVLTQSKRHAFLLSLLKIPHLIVAVNKMDLVDYSESRYKEIVEEYSEFCKNLGIPSVIYMPISALKGDNVVNMSSKMPWYKGGAILDLLESLSVSRYNQVDFRFPVQLSLRPDISFRGYAGKIVSGSIKEGQEILVMSSMKETKVKSIIKGGKKVDKASCPESVILEMQDDIDISRGDVIVRKDNRATVISRMDAMLCWMDDKSPLVKNKRYILKHTTKKVGAFIRRIYYKVDVNTTHRIQSGVMDMNDIGKVHVELASDIFADKYVENRSTGSFILIDTDTNLTVAAGMIKSFDSDQRKEEENKTIWLTGLPCSGKTTIAKALYVEMEEKGYNVICLDGDDVRETLNSDLGFSEEDRIENLRRISHICNMLNQKGITVIASFVSPTESLRSILKDNIEKLSIIYVNCSVDLCIMRDVKGMYKKALAGEIPSFTGVSAPFESPTNPYMVVNTEEDSLESCVEAIMQRIINENSRPRISSD